MTETIRVPDIDNYTLEIVEGVLILTPKTQYITKEELQRTDFTHSSIIKCDIKDNEGNTISNNKIEYKKILVDIWASMPASKLLQTTTFNFKLTNEKKNKGFNWCEQIKMSVANKDANGSMKEILNMLNVNNYNIKISIQLDTGRVIYYKNNLN
jgi:ribosomal protein L14E/L6E/L27E